MSTFFPRLAGNPRAAYAATVALAIVLAVLPLLVGMAGNAWHWVSSAYRPYPYRADDGREDPTPGPVRATRGGGRVGVVAGRRQRRGPLASPHVGLPQ